MAEKDSSFEDWLVVRGVYILSLDELKAVCLLRIKGDGVSMADFTRKAIPSKVILQLVGKQFVSEFPSGSFNLLPFWKAATPVSFNGDDDPKPKRDSPYSLFNLWKTQFSVDIPTDAIKVQMLAQAKRMLKSRDLAYWQGIINKAKADAFWSNSCRNSITTLEKAALSLSTSESGGDRYERLKK
jgi:hypothetical protein